MAANVNADGCSGEQVVDLTCPCDSDWKNHGEYINCIGHASEVQIETGLIIRTKKDDIISTRAKGGCGKKK